MSDFTSWKWSGTVMIGKGSQNPKKHCRHGAPLRAYLLDYLPLANAHNYWSIHKIAFSHQAISPLSYYASPPSPSSGTCLPPGIGLSVGEAAIQAASENQSSFSMSIFCFEQSDSSI